MAESERCTKHGDPNYHKTDKKATKAARERLDPFLQDLPINTSGPHHQTCHYCAYELGLKHGEESALKKLHDHLLAVVSSTPENNPHPHFAQNKSLHSQETSP